MARTHWIRRTRRGSSRLLVLLPFAMATSVTADPPLGRVNEANVHMTGRLGDRHAANIAYLVALHDRTIPEIDFDMLEPFRNRAGPHERSWDGEYAGKWLDATALMTSNTPYIPLSSRMDAFAADLRATQEPDGYMGIELTRGGPWDLWNMWYVLYGMLSHHEVGGNVASYACAVDTGRYIVNEYLPPGNSFSILGGAWHGGCTVDVLDQLMRLYGYSGDPGLLALGDYISTSYGPIGEMRANGRVFLSHAYVVAAYLGGMVLYDEARSSTENRTWLEAVWQNVVDEHLFHTSSIGLGELLRDPTTYVLETNKQETCATVEWLLWTNRMYEATGDIRYAHQLENTLYNALLGAQSGDGMKWTYHTPMNGGTKGWLIGSTKCCFWSGPRGIARLPRFVHHTDTEGIRVDLYEAGTVTDVDSNGVPVDLTQVTEYPADGGVAITLGLDAPAAFQLKLRLPEWAQQIHLSVNGGSTGVPLVAGEYAILDRTWQDGDVVGLRMDMAVRLKRQPGMPSIDGAAIQRGPEILSMDSRDNPGIDFGAVMLYADPRLVECGSLAGRRRYACRASVGGTPEQVFFTPFADAGGDGATYRTIFPVSPSSTPLDPADVNRDGVVDVRDLLLVLGAWGPCPGCAADVNGDGVVDVLDLLEILGSWDSCP